MKEEHLGEEGGRLLQQCRGAKVDVCRWLQSMGNSPYVGGL